MTPLQDIPKKPDGTYRLLHTADWHLGKLLNDQPRDDEHGRFLAWLLQAVKEHAVDAILLAGDVFDTANPPQSALGLYFDFVSNLFRQGDCSLVIIAGNHDSAAQLEAPKQVLRALNTYVAGALDETPEARILLLPADGNPTVAIALVPFLRDRDLRVGIAGETADAIRSKMAAGIQARYAETADAAQALGRGCPVIATGHLTVVGARTSDSERDIHIGGLGAVTSDSFPEGFAYTALGHLHRPQATDPAGRVRYAGSPIPLSFSEASDSKEVRILDVAANDLTQHGLPIPVFRRLVQVRTTNAQLELALRDLGPATTVLRTWVEVVVEDASLEGDLNERVGRLVEGRDFDVLKVLRGHPAAVAGMEVGRATDEEAITTLLDEPGRVFEHLLAQHPDLVESETESQDLKVAFTALVELAAQPDSEIPS